MKKIARNIKGIKQSALKKHLNATTLAVKTIDKMILSGQIITFGSVSRLAKLSRTFLYNQPKIRNRIEQLRKQHGKKTSGKFCNKRNIKIAKLLQSNKLLEAENYQLKKQLEVLYGELHIKQISIPK